MPLPGHCGGWRPSGQWGSSQKIPAFHLENHLCTYVQTRNGHKNVPCSQQAWFFGGWRLLVANELFPLLKLLLGWYISVCATSQSVIHHRAAAHCSQRVTGAQSPWLPRPGPQGRPAAPWTSVSFLQPRKISHVAEAVRPAVGSCLCPSLAGRPPPQPAAQCVPGSETGPQSPSACLCKMRAVIIIMLLPKLQCC